MRTVSKSGLQWSLPTRGAWIEISTEDAKKLAEELSLPTRGAWIEIFCQIRTTASSGGIELALKGPITGPPKRRCRKPSYWPPLKAAVVLVVLPSWILLLA